MLDSQNLLFVTILSEIMPCFLYLSLSACLSLLNIFNHSQLLMNLRYMVVVIHRFLSTLFAHSHKI